MNFSKCSNYSIESIKSDLCISCYDNYYPIYSNILNQNSFLKCYQLPKGYYLDEKVNSYKKCYSSCETCIEKGNNTYHNCNSCLSDFPKQLTIGSYINCYQNCDFYTHYDTLNEKIIVLLIIHVQKNIIN